VQFPDDADLAMRRSYLQYTDKLTPRQGASPVPDIFLQPRRIKSTAESNITSRLSDKKKSDYRHLTCFLSSSLLSCKGGCTLFQTNMSIYARCHGRNSRPSGNMRLTGGRHTHHSLDRSRLACLKYFFPFQQYTDCFHLIKRVTELRPKDTEEEPYYYTFTVQCSSCRETHPNWVSFTRFVSCLSFPFSVTRRHCK
jgi:hypothetical protein